MSSPRSTSHKSRAFALCLLLQVGFLPLLAAQYRPGGLSQNERDSFEKGQPLLRFQQGPARQELLPGDFPPLAGLASKDRWSDSILVEMLQKVQLPATWQGLDTAWAMERLWIILHQFRTMKGLQYWSHRENQYRDLYSYSTLVQSDSKRQEIPDPQVRPAAAAPLEYLVQEDSRLGRNLYELTYTNPRPNALQLEMINMETMWYGIIPVVDPRRLSTRILVWLEDDTLVFYGASDIWAGNIFGMGERLGDSYRNRFAALRSWLLDRLQQ